MQVHQQRRRKLLMDIHRTNTVVHQQRRTKLLREELEILTGHRRHGHKQCRPLIAMRRKHLQHQHHIHDTVTIHITQRHRARGTKVMATHTHRIHQVPMPQQLTLRIETIHIPTDVIHKHLQVGVTQHILHQNTRLHSRLHLHRPTR